MLVKNPVSAPGPPPPFKNPGSAPACETLTCTGREDDHSYRHVGKSPIFIDDLPYNGEYSQTSLIRASLIRMPHNPNTVPGNLFYRFLSTDSVIHVSQSEHIMGTRLFSDKRGLTVFVLHTMYRYSGEN